MKKLGLVGAIIAALGIAGCNGCEEKQYRLEMENGYTCQAYFHDSEDHVWISKGGEIVGIKRISRWVKFRPSVRYDIYLEGRDPFKIIMENGKYAKDMSWYSDPNREEHRRIYSLVKQCESFLEEKYKKGF